MFSKKATKIDEFFTANLTLCSKCQIDGEDFVNFLWPSQKTRTILQSCTDFKVCNLSSQSYKDKLGYNLFEKFTLSQFETKFRIAAGYCINNVSLKIIDRLPHITQANLDEKGGNIKGEQPNQRPQRDD